MIKFRLRHLQAISFLVLVFPVVIFFLGWLRWIFALPAVMLLMAAYYFSVRRLLISRDGEYDSEEVLAISRRSLLSILAVILVWCFFAGQGGFFYQFGDYNWRNAIFRDLLTMKWPVIYAGTDSALVYYISYWLVPALLGKIVAHLVGMGAMWQAANIFMYLWTCLFIFLIFMLVFFALQARSSAKIMLVMLIFIFFSGMDIIGFLCVGRHNLSNISFRIEWWAVFYQYSANTTQLCWVFNQSTPAWLGIALLLNEKKMSNYAFLCALILAFSPLPLIGLILLAGGLAVPPIVRAFQKNNVSAVARQILSPQNIIAALVIAPVFLIYYKSNLAVSHHGFRFDIGVNKFGMVWAIVIYALFCTLEFGILALILLRRYHRNLLYWLAVGSLFLIGMFKLGNGNDFSMRASIPALLVLMVLAIRMLFENSKTGHRGKRRFPSLNIAAAALCIVLMIGAVTPAVEFAGGIHAAYMHKKLDLVADNIKTFSNKPVFAYSNFLSADYEKTPFFRYLARS